MWFRFINKNISSTYLRKSTANNDDYEKLQMRMSIASNEDNQNIMDDFEKGDQNQRQKLTSQNLEQLIKESNSILDQDMLALKNQKIHSMNCIINEFEHSAEKLLKQLFNRFKSNLTDENVLEISKKIRKLEGSKDKTEKVKKSIELLLRLLRNQLNHIYQQQQLELYINNINKYEDQDQDLLFGKLEYDLRKSQLKKLELQFMINVTHCKIDEANNINEYFSNKTKEILQDYKNDYQKLIQIIMIKQKDINEVTNNIITKGESIKQLKEKIYGTYVLEHKLSELDKMYTKKKNQKLDKLEFKISNNLKPQTLHYDIYKENLDKETELRLKKETLKNLSKTNQQNNFHASQKINFMQKSNNIIEKDIIEIDDDIRQLQDKIQEKEIFFMNQQSLQQAMQRKLQIQANYLKQLNVKKSSNLH